MAKYRFEEFAINCTEKKIPTKEDYATYIGLEHMDTKNIHITRWGSEVPIIGEKLVMHKGDILFGKRNTYLRRAAIAPHDGIFSAHGMILRPKENIVDYDFFALFIASDYFFDKAIQISVGSLSPTVNWKDLKDLEFDLPDKKTQKELAKVLWSINDTLDSYKEQLRLCDELVKAQFVEMFGDPVLNAKGLKTEKLSKVCPFNKNIEAVEENNNKVWLLNLDMIETNTGNILDYNMVDIDEVPDSTIRFGDNCVLYSKLRPYLNKVVIPTKSGYATTELLSLNTENINKYYLATALRMQSFVNMINASSYGAKMPRASLDLLREFNLPIPNDKKQKEFEKFYKDLDKSKFDITRLLLQIDIIKKELFS